MKHWAALLLCTLLAACAAAPQAVEHPGQLFHDELFAAPSERIAAADVFALNDAMKRYVTSDIARQAHGKGRLSALAQALYSRGELRLEYDAAMTRNAAQAFDARSGNCLSLVIMTAAFAKELGLPVQYQSAFLEETWSRSGSLLMRSGHVNITLGRGVFDAGSGVDSRDMTIDFLPASEIRGLRTRPISEATVVAMFMNNRAVEALAAGRLDDAYGWVREAVAQSPEFTGSYNTLGVVYRRHGHLAQAGEVFAYLLDREPLNTRAMNNLADVYALQGRTAESAALSRKAAQIEPNPPFHFFNLGLAAMKRDDFRAAREWFAKEVERADYNPEFHFWLGLAHYKLGEIEPARKHLTMAMNFSTSRSEHDLYAAKLDWLRSRQ